MNELRSDDGVIRTTLSEGASRVTEFSQASWTRAGDLAKMTLANRLPRAAEFTGSTGWLAEIAETLGTWWRDTFSAAAEWLRNAWLNTLGSAPNDPSTETANEHNDRLHV